MASHLSGLLASKGKPLICNGKLLMHGRQLVFARIDKGASYGVVFSAAARNNAQGGGEISLTGSDSGEKDEKGMLTEKSLIDSILDFDRKYAPAWNRSPESVSAKNIFKAVDPYTGAVILESEFYQKMMDPYEFHRTDRNYNEAARRIRAELLLEYINNYFDIYTYLFNRRLMSTHMSSFVKGHLVAGLFQPIICSTEFIRSPLIYPAVASFRTLLSGDHAGIRDGAGDIEVRLEPSGSSNRGLQLTCVSMYDFCNRFCPRQVRESGAPLLVPKQMDKRVFMFVLMYLMSGIVNSGLGLHVPLEEKRPVRMQELRDNDELRTFANNLVLGYTELSTQLAVI